MDLYTFEVMAGMRNRKTGKLYPQFTEKKEAVEQKEAFEFNGKEYKTEAAMKAAITKAKKEEK